MKTIPVYETNVLKAFNKADKKGKELLMEMFGAEMFSQKITDRIKTFEDALEMVGCTEEMKLYLNYNGSDADLLSAQAFAKMTIIAKSLNEGWKPDWTSSSEYKYYAWFKGSSGAFVFGFYYYYSGSDVGSRLVFKSAELANYAGKQFESIYQTMFTL